MGKPQKSSKRKSKAKTPDVVVAPSVEERAASIAKESGVDLDALIESLPAEATVRQVLDELCKVDPVIWTMTNRRLKGQPMTFDMTKFLRAGNSSMDILIRHRPFLLQPLRDPAKHKVYIKGRQVGVSELGITEVVHFLDTSGSNRKWIYTFPRDKQLQDFSNTRIAQMFDETPRIKRLLGVPNQTYTKRIGASFLILRSAWESNLGEGIDADGVTFDEKDRMKDGVEVAFKESLSSSKFGFMREVSTPTLFGKGVDLSWRRSDQMTWHVKCTKCGLEQPVEYPDNFVQVKDYPYNATEIPKDSWVYACRKMACRGPIDRTQGRWVPVHSDRHLIRGYHIPQTIAPWISATDIQQKKVESKFLQLFENYVLGRTSKGETILVTDGDFNACTTNYQPVTHRTSDWEKITIGIDWGNKNWIYVLGLNAHNRRRYLLNIGIFEDHATDSLDINEVIKFIAPYEPDVIVADAGYGKDRNAKLLKKFDPNHEGRFYACWYNPSAKTSRTFQPVWGEARVLVDRTITLKTLCRSLKEREIGFPAGFRNFEIFKMHVMALAPLKQEEEGELFETIESTGEDHLAHAAAYATLGMDRITDNKQFQWEFI